ncbi:aromatic amino acid ammonia-lyase [Microvirga sp. M2]|uniref:aromatic amino acid ammonia-lyase n=1 Tax=Microvirga sp. M2 TaxID=3073270 RepID=UPI0039C0CA9C
MSVSALRHSLDGSEIGFDKLVAIGKGLGVELHADALRHCEASRAVFEAAVAAGQPVYGVTTGVGAMKGWVPGGDDCIRFNADLPKAHHFGIGDPLPSSAVRIAMAIRINAALTGRVGCSSRFVRAMADLLNANVTPVVRRVGSLGCADIGLMAQVGCALMGLGEVDYEGRRMAASDALTTAGLVPIELGPKDSLASISTNAIAVAMTVEAADRAARLLQILLALSVSAAASLGASPAPWEAASLNAPKEIERTGAWLHAVFRNWSWPTTQDVHDPLSVRMLAQVYGAVIERLRSLVAKLESASAYADDNPVAIEGRIITSGASLPLHIVLDVEALGMALAHVARSAFNLAVHLGNGRRHDLPVNLVPPGGIATGFGPLLKLAGDLCMRALHEAGPVSTTPLVVADGIEDELTALPYAVERIERQLKSLESQAAILAMMTAQAFDLKGTKPKGLSGVLHNYTRRNVGFYAADRVLSFELEELTRSLISSEGLALLVVVDPALDQLITGSGRHQGASPEVRTSSVDTNVIYATNRV